VSYPVCLEMNALSDLHLQKDMHLGMFLQLCCGHHGSILTLLQNLEVPRPDVTHVTFSTFKIVSSSGRRPGRSKIPQQRMVTSFTHRQTNLVLKTLFVQALSDDLGKLTQAYQGLECTYLQSLLYSRALTASFSEKKRICTRPVLSSGPNPAGQLPWITPDGHCTPCVRPNAFT
jgi:hypothetical protein